ncbi:MAG: phosphoribosylglycinamide formyltransferase [Gammaproteobacteria bacterium]|nr:phosphoribosylglycinamide formyltransferase [Gammaproteobacteria bacterium]
MNSSKVASIVALISGGGTNLQAIIDACASNQLNAEIKAVISNQADAYGLQRAAKASIPTEVIDHALFKDRPSFDRELKRRVAAYQPDLIVMAGFMRILTEEFIDPFLGRIMNIHPSLLPKYRGLHTHRRALKAGDKEHGCSIHFATNELDGGPVILQATVPILEGDSSDSLANRVLEKEHIIYSLSIGWFCEGRIAMRGHRVIMDGRTLHKPLMLDDL